MRARDYNDVGGADAKLFSQPAMLLGGRRKSVPGELGNCSYPGCAFGKFPSVGVRRMNVCEDAESRLGMRDLGMVRDRLNMVTVFSALIPEN